MSKEEFIDYYEVLEASPSANSETIERIFRYLAHRYHPDTSKNNNHEHFNLLVEAYNALRNPAARAAYDVEYRKHQLQKADLLRGAEATGTDSIDRRRMLSIFYAKRRRDMKQPGVGLMTLEQVLGCPAEVLEFHIWYFREKGWIKREESGLLAITAAGVDEIESSSQRMTPSDRLISYSDCDGTGETHPQVAGRRSEKIVKREEAVH
jgi:curved DNA-binding protein CbpA